MQKQLSTSPRAISVYRINLSCICMEILQFEMTKTKKQTTFCSNFGVNFEFQTTRKAWKERFLCLDTRQPSSYVTLYHILNCEPNICLKTPIFKLFIEKRLTFWTTRCSRKRIVVIKMFLAYFDEKQNFSQNWVFFQLFTHILTPSLLLQKEASMQRMLKKNYFLLSKIQLLLQSVYSNHFLTMMNEIFMRYR